MIVSMDTLYHSEFSFLPARNEKGDLEYVDIITSFASAQGGCAYTHRAGPTSDVGRRAMSLIYRKA
ncbi:hypothetical protein KAM621c_21580 [Citrobacter braakii]|uniref:Uncharacterized protein n=1 Tax=Citrobacter braakii TaxID=57706 RepID=A0AAD1L1G0_CITBR|nr:hypothetical protein KAM621c_21580 [Citrobacter braakii]